MKTRLLILSQIGPCDRIIRFLTALKISAALVHSCTPNIAVISPRWRYWWSNTRSTPHCRTCNVLIWLRYGELLLSGMWLIQRVLCCADSTKFGSYSINFSKNFWPQLNFLVLGALSWVLQISAIKIGQSKLLTASFCVILLVPPASYYRSTHCARHLFFRYHLYSGNILLAH